MKKLLKFNKLNLFFVLVLTFALNFDISHAQPNDCSDITCVIDGITDILAGNVVTLIFAIALVVFFWGVVQYVINTESDSERAKGKQFMIWGLIALTVMFAVYGIVRVLAGTFGIDVDVLPKLPIPTGD